MSTIIVAAIPSKDEEVHKISSEPVAHMTLLYMQLPLDADLETITSFVRHAAETSLRRFGIVAVRRGTLGENQADVLFFENSFELTKLREFRGRLVLNDTISKYYHGTDQFPGWIPHLTLGYPQSPAKTDDDFRENSWINFDRIVIYEDDYKEIVSVDLKPDWTEFQEDDLIVDQIAMDAIGDPDLVIYHHGIKGQRWGVRRSVGPDGLVRSTAKKALEEGSGSSKSKGASKDHKRVLKNLNKPISSLTNEELKEITNRVKAMNEANAAKKKWTEAQRNRERSKANKAARWVLAQLAAGAKAKTSSVLKETSGDLVEKLMKDVGLKDASKTKNPSDKFGDKSKNKKPKDKSKKDDSDSDSKKDDVDDNSKQVDDLDERQRRVRDFTTELILADGDGVYEITSLPGRKKGG